MPDSKLDLKSALREAFGKCPEHNERAVVGYWLKWCPKKTCSWIVPK